MIRRIRRRKHRLIKIDCGLEAFDNWESSELGREAEDAKKTDSPELGSVNSTKKSWKYRELTKLLVGGGTYDNDKTEVGATTRSIRL